MVLGDTLLATLRDPARRRERGGLRGVVRGAQLPGRRQALVLTLDQSDRLVEDGVTIDVQPA